MKIINIFLGSSITDLHEERLEIVSYIQGLNNKLIDEGIFVRIYLCEETSNSMAKNGSQSIHDEFIADKADATFFMFFSKAGEYTLHELELARNTFLKNEDKPDVYVFFKTIGENKVDNDEIKATVDKIEKEYSHYYKTFEKSDTVKLAIKEYIDSKTNKNEILNGSIENINITLSLIKTELANNKILLEQFFDKIERLIEDDKAEKFISGCCYELSGEESKKCRDNTAELHSVLRKYGSYREVCELLEMMPIDKKLDKIIEEWCLKETLNNISEFNNHYKSLITAEKSVKQYFAERMEKLKNTLKNTYESDASFQAYHTEQWLLSLIFTEIFRSGLIFSKSIEPQDAVNSIEETRRMSHYNGNLSSDSIGESDVWRDKFFNTYSADKSGDSFVRSCYRVIEKWFAGNDDLISCL